VRPSLRGGLLVLVSVLSGACVYYNGMYNANRLAGSARKAEREGRTFDANNLWGQVATKAESVVARHPTSKYAEPANVLRGIALARLGQCEPALAPLSRASLMPASDLTEDALLATGQCQLALGNAPASQAAFGSLLDSKNRERRSTARLHHARSLRQQGRYSDALRLLEGVTDQRADGERILALAGVGRLSHALVIVDSLLGRRDTTMQWDSLVAAMARQNPPAASRLIDRIQRIPVRSQELRARQLLEDGRRLVRSDTARAQERFRQAIELSGSKESAGRANLELARMKLRSIERPEDLAPLVTALEQVSINFEMAAEEARQLATLVGGVHEAATRVTWETLRGDLRLFLAAEVARDSLQSPALAGHIFRRILDDFPNSSYAGKVVLALQRLEPTCSDSARALLDGLYSDSPYLAMVRGQDPPEYRLLEDSLGAFAASSARKAPQPATRRVPPGRDVEGPRRRPPAPGTSRVPEQ
jgi:tetratricopeptide (TPR) repeat protein